MITVVEFLPMLSGIHQNCSALNKRKNFFFVHTLKKVYATFNSLMEEKQISSAFLNIIEEKSCV
jgi:hypothetical protein